MTIASSPLGRKPGTVVTAPLPRAWPWYSDPAAQRVRDRVAAGDVYAFGRHDTIVELETWARSYFGVPFALAVSSGTAALGSAFFALGLRPGDEVLVPTYTFHATCTPLFPLGAVPVLYDCDPHSARADVADLATRITPRTRAIVVTHMFGLPAEMDEVLRLARAHGLAVVEDAAQAHGARYRGRLVGTIGDIGCFSLGGQKTISGGMGGLILTDRADLFEKALCLGHAHERAFEEIDPASSVRRAAEMGFGANLRMHPLAAELALDHCRSLDARIAVRTEVLGGLTAMLRAFPFLSPPETPADCTRGGWYGYKVRYHADRLEGLPVRDFVGMLKRRGLAVSVPTTRPLHQMWPFTGTGGAGEPLAPPVVSRPGGASGALPGATALYAETIGFPDKHLHEPADELLAQYVSAIADAAETVMSTAGGTDDRR